MKKFLQIVFVLLVLSIPKNAFAFAEDPVAVVIMGDYSRIDKQMADDWNIRVKRRFRFPDYKILPNDEVMSSIRGNLPAVEQKAPYFRKAQLAKMAETIPSEVVFVIWVHRFSEEVIYSWRPWGETLQRVTVHIDVTAYRKTDGKYVQGKIRYSEVNNIANSEPARKVAADKISEVVDKAKEQMPRLEKEQKNAE